MRDPALRNSLLTSVLITLAMMVSVVIYVPVAIFFVRSGQTFATAETPGLHGVLLGAAMLCAAGGLGFFRMQTKPLFEDSRATSPELVLTRLLRARIVGLALAETAAILGLVLTLTTGNIRWSVALSLISLATMAALWPRRRQLERLVLPGEVRAIEPN